MDSNNAALAVILLVIAAFVGLAAVLDFVRHFMFNGIEMAVVEPPVLGMQSFLAVPQLIEQFPSSSPQTALPHQMMSFRVNLSLIEYERSFTDEEMALLVNGVVARCMEDKWEVEFQHVDEPHVLFMRSWSRNQVFAVLPVNQDMRTCTDPELSASPVSYTHLTLPTILRV